MGRITADSMEVARLTELKRQIEMVLPQYVDAIPNGIETQKIRVQLAEVENKLAGLQK